MSRQILLVRVVILAAAGLTLAVMGVLLLVAGVVGSISLQRGGPDE